jgi:hypothetical protein
VDNVFASGRRDFGEFSVYNPAKKIKMLPPLSYSLIFSPFLLLICCPHLSPVFFISTKTHLPLPFLLQTERLREMMRQRRETEAEKEIHCGEELPEVARFSSSKDLTELGA